MSTTGTFREGWLYKLSWLNIHKTWRRRYFVLKDSELRYYKQPDDMKPAGVIELRHYRRVGRHPVKQSPWAFRVESRCRHHLNQFLYAEDGTDEQLWIESIQAHLDKQHQQAGSQHHQCGSSAGSSSSGGGASAIDESVLSNDSVLDKWLERLDLHDDKPSSSSSCEELAPPPLDAPSLRRPVSLSFALGYQSNDSLDTVGSMPAAACDYYAATTPPPASSVPTPSSPASSSASTNDTQRPSSALLANAFSQNSRLRRRLTSTSERLVSVSASASSCQLPQQQQQQHHHRRQHRSPPLSPQSLDTRRREAEVPPPSCAADAFHLEHDDRRPRYARYSMDALMMPPRHPPPTAPLPAPPPSSSPSSRAATAAGASSLPPRRFSTHSSARY